MSVDRRPCDEFPWTGTLFCILVMLALFLLGI